MQVQAIAIRASLPDDLGTERVDVKLCRLFWITGLEMHMIQLQSHDNSPRIVAMVPASGVHSRSSRSHAPGHDMCQRKSGAERVTHVYNSAVSGRIRQDTTRVKPG